jgi:hydrogenase maturation factor HypF (carbamoyltransferase family)
VKNVLKEIGIIQLKNFRRRFMEKNKEKELENTHFLKDLGFCNHKWKFIRTEKGDYKAYDICECIKCGKRKRFRTW